MPTPKRAPKQAEKRRTVTPSAKVQALFEKTRRRINAIEKKALAKFRRGRKK